MSLSSMDGKLGRRRRRLKEVMQRHGSIVLMLSAQLCSAILATIGRILRIGHGRTNNEPMGTSEILLFMMTTTMLLSWTYIYTTKLPDRPLGPSSTRLLLCLRGTAGFFGIWGFYFSLRYLALAEATIINFLAPILAVLVLGLFPGAALSLPQLLAGFVSMVGVIFVLQPWSDTLLGSVTGGATAEMWKSQALAIGAAFVGVAGGALGYIAMARLGDRVHPILTIAYFSTFCVVLSTLLLVVQQEKLRIPSSPMQWALSLALGILAFAMQCLITASLSWDGDSKRPLNFVYTQIVFAMAADKVIWGVSPNAWKYVGVGLIIGSAVFVASTKASKASHQYALVQSSVDGEEEDDELELELELEMSKERAEVANDVEA